MRMSRPQPKEGLEEEHVHIARCWYRYCVSFTGLYPLMLLNENKKALAAEDQSQEPKMLITIEMQKYTQGLDRYRISDRPQKAVFRLPFLHSRSSYG